MAIIGIAMSFVLPALAKGVRQWRIQGAVQEMVTLFKFTRNQAVARRTQLQVVMDRARRVYWLDNADAPVLTDPDQADERGIRLFSLPAGLRFGRVTIGSVTVADDRVGIAFLSRGNSTGGDVEILDDRGRRYSIRVDPLTGHARAQRAG
jgi:Tfp pilus assembly protein FimT